ncbi:OmpA family protein [Erwinia amylovora]
MNKFSFSLYFLISHVMFLISLISGTRHYHFYYDYFFSLFSFFLSSLILLSYYRKKMSFCTEREGYHDDSDLTTVVFVIGPYATKWFSDSSFRFLKKTVWICIPDINKMSETYEKVKLEHDESSILAFFPYIPDAHENEENFKDLLLSWQQSFMLFTTTVPMRCVLAFYARLSNEYHSLGHDQTTWVYNSEFISPVAVDLKNALLQLSGRLDEEAATLNVYSVQRQSCAKLLFFWLNESGIADQLTTAFTESNLILGQVAIADYGHGFVRHGAWSRWLEKNFGILPGLAGRQNTLPLPPVLNHLPASDKTDYYNRPCWSRISFIVTSLLSVILLITFIYVTQHTHIILKTINNLPIQMTLSNKIKKYETSTLSEESHYLTICSKTSSYFFLNLDRCDILLNKVNDWLSLINATSEQRTHYSLSLFSSHSAAITSEGEAMLYDFLPLIKSDKRYEVTGYADNTGNSQENITLSKKRARVVSRWLAGHSNIPYKNILSSGAGEANPVAGNFTDDERSQNRRVVITPLNTYN